MKEMNYTPSSIATRLAKRSSHNIGLLIDMTKESEYMNPFFYNIMVGIESVIGPLSYELTIANVEPIVPDRNVIDRLVHSGRIDGLIANNVILNDQMAATLRDLGFPFVSMGEYGDGIPWVDFDNEAGGSMLTDHLLSQGCEDIAFLGGEPGEKLFTKRHAGYEKALLAAGQKTNASRTFSGIADEQLGYCTALELLRSDNPPDAVICMNNYVAFGALKAAQEVGAAIPGLFSIATFDDYPFSPHTTPPLTSLFIQTFELGAAAGRMLTDILRHPEETPAPLLLQPELIVRASTLRDIDKADWD